MLEQLSAAEDPVYASQLNIATYVEKMKILDYFMIANGKECD